MNLNGQLNDSLKHELCDRSHPSKSSDFECFHAEDYFVESVDAALDWALVATKYFEWKNDRCVDHERLIHDKHVDQEHWSYWEPRNDQK